MPPSKRNVRDTLAALKAIIHESLKHPEKKQEFVDEGSIQIIIGESLHIDKTLRFLFAKFWTVLMSIPPTVQYSMVFVNEHVLNKGILGTRAVRVFA